MSVVPFHAPLTQTFAIVPAETFCASFGVNEGEAISRGADLLPDDIYRLTTDARTAVLALQRTAEGSFTVARTSHTGTAGNMVHLDCLLTLMTPTASVAEVLVLVEVDASGHAVRTFLLPLSPLEARVDYSLIAVDQETAALKFGQSACASLTRGTRIALGDGRQKPVEDLRAGDEVLTRDAGVQTLRWIGRTIQRASGDFAPVRIAAGALDNAADLQVSPDHRLFIQHRGDQPGTGRAEVLVKAGQLVNGRDVTVEPGGFVEYFQLLFDRHQIIFAEGIAAESLLVDDRTISMLPAPLARTFRHGAAAGLNPALVDLSASGGALRPDTADLLRRVSTP